VSDQQSESPEFDEGQGWRVLDADGNVIASGGVSIARMDGKLAGLVMALSPSPVEVGRQVANQIRAYIEGEQE
jgi:hypothetical protein